MSDLALTAVPAACTLPTAERPVRLAEIDGVLAVGVRRRSRPASTWLRWTFDPTCEAAVRELVARESQCCGFFAFTVTRVVDAGVEALVLDVRVPPAQVDVLDALEARAVPGASS